MVLGGGALEELGAGTPGVGGVRVLIRRGREQSPSLSMGRTQEEGSPLQPDESSRQDLAELGPGLGLQPHVRGK